MTARRGQRRAIRATVLALTFDTLQALTSRPSRFVSKLPPFETSALSTWTKSAPSANCAAAPGLPAAPSSPLPAKRLMWTTAPARWSAIHTAAGTDALACLCSLLATAARPCTCSPSNPARASEPNSTNRPSGAWVAHAHRDPRQPGEGVLHPTSTTRRLSPLYRDLPARYGAVALTSAGSGRIHGLETEIHLVDALPADQRLRAHAQRIGACASSSSRFISARRSRPSDSARLEDKSKNWRFSTFTFAGRSALQPRSSH